MLPLIYRGMASKWGIEPSDEDAEGFRYSIRSWPPFPDTVEALKALGTQYGFVAVTNADAACGVRQPTHATRAAPGSPRCINVSRLLP